MAFVPADKCLYTPKNVIGSEKGEDEAILQKNQPFDMKLL